MAPAQDLFGFEGQIVDGQVRVEKLIGEGGVSVVYRGYHLGLEEPVAFKCLKLPQVVQPGEINAFTMRFRDESRLAYRLSRGNLNIVRSITSGTTIAPFTGALLPYMALEWLEGQSLEQEFRDRRALGRPYTLDEVVRLLEPAVQALEYAHSQHVIHRDVKPGNLFLADTRDGVRLKVLDFGLAKILHDDTLAFVPSVKTMSTVPMCSPSYGAPEQFDPSLGPIGPWTDVYALGLVFVEALTNRRARPAATLEEGAALALSKTSRPTPRAFGVNVGAAVEAVLSRALSLHPSERPASALEFWGLLRDALLSVPVQGAMARTLDERHLPQLAKVSAERAPAVTEERLRTPPPPAPVLASGGLLATTLRMDDAPKLPRDMVSAVSRAEIAKTAPSPSPTPAKAPPASPYADTIVAPEPAPHRPAAAEPMVPTSFPPQKALRVPVLVALAVLVVFLFSAAAFVAALYVRRHGG